MSALDEVARLRTLAADLRRLAADEPRAATKTELLDLASRCETTANNLEGNGSHHSRADC